MTLDDTREYIRKLTNYKMAQLLKEWHWCHEQMSLVLEQPEKYKVEADRLECVLAIARLLYGRDEFSKALWDYKKELQKKV